MSNLLNKVVTGVSTIAMAASMLVMPATTHAATAGEVYKSTDGTVWFITSDMHRRPFTSAGAFMSYGFLSFSQVKDADSSVTALPTGDFIAPQDGRIFCATETKGSDVAGECSLITGSKKAAFTSASVFSGQGFSFSRAFYGDSSFLSKTSNVDNASAQHLPGTLINNNGTVQLVVSGGLWGVPSMDVFNSWGWSFADVVPANSADVLLSQTGVIPARMAGDLVPTATTTPTNPGDCNLTGSAGNADINTTSTDVEDQVSTGDSETKVAGIRVEAQDSDIALKSVKVTLHNDGTGSTRLDRYADEVMIFAGDDEVGSADVSDFTKSGTDYTKVISLDCAEVQEGAGNKQNFYVVINAISHIDGADAGNEWHADMNQIRYEDAQGAILTDPGTFLGNGFEFVNLAGSGDVKATVSIGSNNPVASNVEVSDTTSTSSVKMLEFKVKASGTDMSFDTLAVALDSTGVSNATQITPTLTLKKGSTTVSTQDVGVGADPTVNFDLDNDQDINDGDTVTYSVYAKVNKIGTGTGVGTVFDQGDSLKISWGSFASSLIDSNGDDVVTINGSAPGNNQTFISQGAIVTFDSDDFTAEDVTNTVDGTIRLTFDVTALGDNDVTMSQNQGATQSVAAGNNVVSYTLSGETATGATIACDGLTAQGGIFTVSAGDTKTCTLSVKFNTTTGFVTLTINSVDGTTVTDIHTRDF